MRIVIGVVLSIVAAMGLWLLVEQRPPADAVRATPAPPRDDPRAAELEARVSNLEAELRRLAADLAASERHDRTPLPPTFVAPSDNPRTGDGIDPRWYLQQYVRSFEGGGEGSEYFRLAVDAYAIELVSAICVLVRANGSPPALRARLAAILGSPRFARHPDALDTLVALLRNSGDERLGLAALAALEVIGDAPTAIVLERAFPELTSLDLKRRALATLVRLGGPDANRALERLFATVSSAEERALVLGALSTADADAALAVFRQASHAEDGVRMQAANAIGKFRGEAITAFIDQWLGYETDARVQQILGQARARMNEVRPYAAQKATGPPDADPNQDHPNAWASQNANMGLQWLELGYQPARRASALRIHEVSVAGAVVEVIAVDEGGRRHQLWAGVDPTPRPGVFEVRFAPTTYRVRSVRIVLDTDKRQGWSEVDAVELVGPDGNAWASEAKASSSYGQ